MGLADGAAWEKDYPAIEQKTTKDRYKIDAVLHDVAIVIMSGRHRLVGTIEADTSDRFPDGTVVATSAVVEQMKNVYRTKNTTYFIASWRKQGVDHERPFMAGQS